MADTIRYVPVPAQQIIDGLLDVFEPRLKMAAVAAEAEVVRLLSRGQPTRMTKSTRAHWEDLGSRSGASVYVKGHRGHRVGLDPSKPGEPPKVVTSRLKGSVTWKVKRLKRSLTAYVGTNVKYAARLEFGFVGTDARGRSVSQEPRPFLRPGILGKKDVIVRIIREGR